MPAADKLQNKPTKVKSQDSGHGTGGLIINLPDEMLQAIGVTVGDKLSLEVVDGVIILRPLRIASSGHGV